AARPATRPVLIGATAFVLVAAIVAIALWARTSGRPAETTASAAATVPPPIASSTPSTAYQPIISTMAAVRTDGFAVGPAGSLIGTDHARNLVFAIRADGSVAPFAGGGDPRDGVGDGLLATQARLDGPVNITRGEDGSVYIAEWGPHVIRRVA